MRRHFGWAAIGLLLLIAAVVLLVYGSPANHPSLGERVHSLASQLRCPACEGQSVADSSTDVAVSIRGVIRRRLQSGESPGEVEKYLESRYPGISLAPSGSGLDSVAWLAPPLLVVGGIGLLAVLVLDWRARGRRIPESPGPARPVVASSPPPPTD